MHTICPESPQSVTITAAIFQDTDGNAYLAPEFSNNADQAALEAGAIVSLTLDSLFGNSYSGLTGSRETINCSVCFAAGTRIRTPDGDRAVETLKPGDLVETLDNGPQAIRWIGGRSVPAISGMKPVHFAAGSRGANLPRRPMMLSRQHRVLLHNAVAERMTGTADVLVPAYKLAALPGVNLVNDRGFVTCWHFLSDAHEVVFAEDTPAETLYLGAKARKCLTAEAFAEIERLYPELTANAPDHPPAREILTGKRINRLPERH